MKKNAQHLMQFAVGLTILLGILTILLANQKSFKKIVADDIENISQLSASIIYAEIDNSLTKPIFVGQTMANDLFLKNWLTQENPTGGDTVQNAVMQQYLMNYCIKYGYDSVFAVSAKSNIYYHQEGINKVISPQNAHDVWYYNFVASGEPYDLDVDVDEANSDQLTVFINCRITSDKGELMGVVGVGIRMSHLQALLQQYEQEYDLRAFLIDENGLVQVDSNASNIEAVNLFDDSKAAALRESIVENKEKMQMFWYPENGSEHCLITKYIENLDWYVVVEKNTLHTQQALNSQINCDLMITGTIIVLVLLMISYVIAHYNRMLLKTASLDEVTNLPNMKMFEEIFNKNAKRQACCEGVLFMYDIDHFKAVNDRFGHMFGNTVLYRVSEISKKIVGNKGMVARWGGDEFVGVIYGDSQEVDALLYMLVQQIDDMQEGELKNLTISLGATHMNGNSNLGMLINAADKAMYRSKDMGRNRATIQ
ncbi:MAG: diguanylate cyclase [Angelakisella sp.]